MRRQMRNHPIHALHSNGMTDGPHLQARQLQELQFSESLRATIWTPPSTVKPNTPVRVYDTRLERQWMENFAAELRGGSPPMPLIAANSDFLSTPAVDDEVALQRDHPLLLGPPLPGGPGGPGDAVLFVLRRGAPQMPAGVQQRVPEAISSPGGYPAR